MKDIIAALNRIAEAIENQLAKPVTDEKTTEEKLIEEFNAEAERVRKLVPEKYWRRAQIRSISKSHYRQVLPQFHNRVTERLINQLECMREVESIEDVTRLPQIGQGIRLEIMQLSGHAPSQRRLQKSS